MRTTFLILAAALATGGCTTASVGSGPVEVSRFHLGAPLERGTITVEPMPGGGPASLEFQTYADAVHAQLAANGYIDPTPGGTAQYLAVVGFQRTNQPVGPARSPVTIGLGGGGYSGGYRGGGVGLGGGFSIPLGRPKAREAVISQMMVQIRRRADGAAIWEGKAQTYAGSTQADAQAPATAAKLARALFTGFPGESGRTITVR